jgi:hypothetical protein
VTIPITVKCECGVVTKAMLGEAVTCTCGRAYETSKLPRDGFGEIPNRQARIRLYVQLGIVFVGGATVLAAVLEGLRGVAIALPLSGLLWFQFFGRWLRKRWLRDAYKPSTTYQLEASEP